MRKQGYCFLFALLTAVSVLYLWWFYNWHIENALQRNVHVKETRISEWCSWMLLDLPEWPLERVGYISVNAALLLYLGLMNDTSSINEANLTNQQDCQKFQTGGSSKAAITFAPTKYVVDKVASNSSLFCEVLQNIDKANKKCYSLKNHEKLLTLNDPSTAVRYFDPRSFDIPKVYSWSKDAVQDKKVKLENGVLLLVPNKSILFQNSTFITRFYFLLKPSQAMKVFTFEIHLLISEKPKSFYLSKDLCKTLRFETACNFYDIQQRAARWLMQFLHQASLAVSEGSSEWKSAGMYHLLSADFYFGATLDDVHLLCVHSELHSFNAKNANDVSSPLNYQLLKTAINFLSRPATFSDSKDGIIKDGFCAEDEKDLSVITSITLQPAFQLFPTFLPTWTSYYLSMPYTVTHLSFNVNASFATAEVTLLEDQAITIGMNWHNISIGVGWNSFKIQVTNKNTLIRPVTYKFNVFRKSRESLREPVKDEQELVACQLEQDCDLIFKANEPCGLQPASFDSWNSALDAWNKLPPCGQKNDASGVWMVPCLSCRSEGSCYWSRARWQPAHCRYSTPNKLQECLADRQLIFVGDSTNRGMMESLVERLDARLTPSDRIKWHTYRYRRANRTHFHYDYYPKFWLEQRPTLEQTLVRTMRRANGSIAAIVVGGLDWLSASHLDAIRRVVGAVKVVVKTAGYSAHRVTDDLAATTSRLAELSALARAAHHFLTIDTWNMTAARFRDFSPGRCQCHFHQIVESGHGSGRFRSSGAVNRAYTDILVHHLCDSSRVWIV